MGGLHFLDVLHAREHADVAIPRVGEDHRAEGEGEVQKGAAHEEVLRRVGGRCGGEGKPRGRTDDLRLNVQVEVDRGGGPSVMTSITTFPKVAFLMRSTNRRVGPPVALRKAPPTSRKGTAGGSRGMKPTAGGGSGRSTMSGTETEAQREKGPAPAKEVALTAKDT